MRNELLIGGAMLGDGAGIYRLYKNMNTIKIDNSNISISETVDKIIEVINN